MFGPPKNPRKAAEFAQARRLRVQGTPIREIARLLGVSQSSVSLWTSDVELTAEQRRSLRVRAAQRRGMASSENWRRRRLAYQDAGRTKARERDPLHMAGCMLYWAEGAKDRNSIVFANGDPAMLEFFSLFLREIFGLTSEDFTFNLNVYTNNGLTIDEIELYWMHQIGLSRRCARKHMVNYYPTSSSGRRIKKLPYGVCTLKVKNSTRLVQHIYGAIQEYSGIDQPDWLDGTRRK